MPDDPSPPVPPQGDVRRLILLLGAAGFAGAIGGRVLDPFVSGIAQEYAAPVDQAALLATAYAMPFALIQPILGPVGDALGKRRIIRIGLVALALCCLATPFAPSLGALLVLRALAGMAAGGVMPLTLAAVGDAVPLKDRQVALSRLLTFSISGQIAGGALAGVLADPVGWRGLVWLCGALAAGAAALNFLVPFGGPPEPRGRFDPVRSLGRYRMIYGMAAARLLYLSVAVEGVLIFGTFPWFAPMLEARGLGGTAEAGMAVAAFGAGGILYTLIARMLLVRLGQRRMVVLGGGLAAMALLGFALAPSAAVFILAGLLLGAGFYMMHNSIQTWVTEVAPEARGSAVALHACHFFLGQSLGPILVGLLIGGAGAPVAMTIGAVGLVLLGLRLGRR